MAPRYAYWTIILADGPTSFRARDRDSLVPTLRQLQSRDPKAELKWFANGRLWSSPEQAIEYARLARLTWKKTRGPDWRPGGAHRDPRARFKKSGSARGRPSGPPGTSAGRARPTGPSTPATGRPSRPRVPRGGQAPGDTGRDGRQRRPYRPTGGTRRGGGGGGGKGRGGGGRR